MIHFWKLTNMIKGVLTFVPVVNDWRKRCASTHGTNSSRYCYSVWLRHLVTLNRLGFTIKDARVGELGPGDSIGIGLSALLSGARQYVGLDIVPFSVKADLEKIFVELEQLYSRKVAIPDQKEFPLIRPSLDSYAFPGHLIETENLTDKILEIRKELNGKNIGKGGYVTYQAPWHSRDDITASSLDLVFSQAVLEHVDNLTETYEAMYAWLKPGGYASHVIDFRAHHLSPNWNGHWAYSDWEWRIVRGKREFLLNRFPVSMHLDSAKTAGFEILSLECNESTGGLPPLSLSPRYRQLSDSDLRTSGAVLILRK